jgi:hypothetical protein
VTGLTLLGSYYKFKIQIFNEIGSTTSLEHPILLSDVPDKPQSTPYQDFVYTTRTQIRVHWDLLLDSENGGATIDGYDLWRDDGASGDFTRLFMQDTVIASSFTDISVKESITYRYKYRAHNANGWGDFSEPGYLFAASVPDKPAPMERLSFSSSEIELQIYAPQETGGNDVTFYELWVDNGFENTQFRNITSYDGQSLSYLVDESQENMVVGRTYSFKYRTRNLVGYSEYSQVLRVALADQVQAPLNLHADFEQATSTSLTLVWDEVPDGYIVTQGYFLEMLQDDDKWLEVFSQRTNPNALTTTVTSLIPAKLYKFRVFAVDFNDISEASDIIEVYACGLPRDF